MWYPSSARSERRAPAGSGVRTLVLTVGPLEDVKQAEELLALFSEITDLGTIEPGKRADLVRIEMIDAIPVVRSVWRAGQRVA